MTVDNRRQFRLERRKHLRWIMRKFDLKAPEVAKILDVQPQTVRCYMCGTRAFPRRHLDKVQNHVRGLTA